MKRVAFDQPKFYPAIPPPRSAWGELRNQGTGLCLDTKFKTDGQPQVDHCLRSASSADGLSGEQNFEHTWHMDVRPMFRSYCLDVSQHTPRSPVIMFQCHGMKGNQHWKYNLDVSFKSAALNQTVNKSLIFIAGNATAPYRQPHVP